MLAWTRIILETFLGSRNSERVERTPEEAAAPDEVAPDEVAPDEAAPNTRAKTPDALENFQNFLEEKQKALEDMKKIWMDQRVSEAEMLRTQSPFMASALEENPMPASALLPTRPEKSLQNYILPPTDVDEIPIKSTTATWFESILSMVREAILPADQILERIEVSSQEHIKPLLDKLQEKEKNIEEWNANLEDKLAPSALAILRQEICTYAIDILESQITMLEMVKREIDLCIGWEHMTEALCKQLLTVLDASVAVLVLPKIDFSSSYRVSLHAEITPNITKIEEQEAGPEGALRQAQSLLLFKLTKNPIVAPKPTHIRQDSISSLSS